LASKIDNSIIIKIEQNMKQYQLRVTDDFKFLNLKINSIREEDIINAIDNKSYIIFKVFRPYMTKLGKMHFETRIIDNETKQIDEQVASVGVYNLFDRKIDFHKVIKA
jgi:hypothetical protein